MKLIRQILFAFVLLIILGHASMAHSHARSNTLCQIQAPAEPDFLYLLKVAVNSDTGSHHLEDYKQGKEAFFTTSLLGCTCCLMAVQLIHIQPLNGVSERIMHPASIAISFHPFGTSYTLRGSPYLA